MTHEPDGAWFSGGDDLIEVPAHVLKLATCFIGYLNIAQS